MTTFNRRRLVASFSLPVAFVVALSGVAAAGPGVGTLVREAVEMAFRKSGREVVERVSREAAEEAVEKGVAKYGPRAAQAVADGGMELVEASARYGDDVMRVAIEASPAARRALALEPGRMLPLVREFGEEAIELEAKSPGLARQVFANFGDDGARQIARQVPAGDMPRLLSYAEKADNAETRRLLLEAYKKEGPSIFERIPPKLVLASGLTGAMLYGTHRVTAPLDAMGDAMRNDPTLARDVSNGFLWIYGTVAILATVFILASFRLTPWHAVKPRADRGQPVDGGRPPSPEIGSAESQPATTIRG